MAISRTVAFLQQRRVATRFAAALTTAGILLIAPIYLVAQWGPAQSPMAPWWVALVREPFFAKIMWFGEGPAFWPLFIATWAAALAFWTVAISRRRKNRKMPVVPSASNSNDLAAQPPHSRAA